MRVWDINPGYLDRGRLLGEHRELHGLWTVIRDKKRGYAHHPETVRWWGHIQALSRRHETLVAEMRLRGYRHHSPVEGTGNGFDWPETFIDSPDEQFALLREKYGDDSRGRIPLPRSSQELWSQHKYSMLARDQARYRSIGRAVAGPKSAIGFEELAKELTLALREPVFPGGLHNALTHMWGHVSKYTRKDPRALVEEPVALLVEIRRLARQHDCTYLIHSTALGELEIFL